MGITHNYGHVISGFPGVGKSSLVSDKRCEGYKVIDLDSTSYSKGSVQNGVRCTAWLDSYVKDICKYRLEYDFVLVSSHNDVRKKMAEYGVDFWLVFPGKERKLEYITRYKNRGSTDAFIELLSIRWDSFIDGCFNEHSGRQMCLNDENMYISSILDIIRPL